MATCVLQDSWADLEYATNHRAVSFEQLAYVHLARRAEFETRADYCTLATQYYPRVIAAFCKKHGKIIESYDRYWPQGRKGAIFAIVTEKDQVYARYFKPRPSEIDASLAELLVDVEALLADCLTKARTTLDIFPPGAARREQLLGLFDHTYSLLALLDDLLHVAQSDRVTQRLATLTKSYDTLKARYDAFPKENAVLATQEARFKFFAGMLKASGWLLVVLTAITLGLPKLLPQGVAWAFPAEKPVTLTLLTVLGFTLPCLAGGVGAVLSVLQRVQSGTLALEYRLGWKQNRMLGQFRPLIGAIVAVALVIFLKGGILNFSLSGKEESSIFWLTSLAFLAGFSERFAHIVLGKAEGTVTPQPEAQTEPKPAVDTVDTTQSPTTPPLHARVAFSAASIEASTDVSPAARDMRRADVGIAAGSTGSTGANRRLPAMVTRLLRFLPFTK